MKTTDEVCPKCGEKLTIENGDQLYCRKCIHYKIEGKWMKIWCDEYHRHNKNCLIEVVLK
jgi:hypothetical protein